MTRIETHHPKIPWSWAAWITFPWVAVFYVESVSNNGPLIFTLRRFVENPSLIALLMSLNVAFNFIVGVFASYMSDRTWTRWGRRRPFLIVGWTGAALAMACIPLAKDLWVLILVVVVLQFCADIAKPNEPLYNEVIPARQRGRASMMRGIVQNLMGMLFFGVLLTQFDDSHAFNALGRSFELSGEQVLYWTGSFLMLCVVIFLAFFVRERPPPGGVVQGKMDFPGFFRDIFGQRQWWNLYLLYSAPLFTTIGLELYKPLLQNEQLGFSKADIGWASMVGMIVAMVIFIPAAGFIADKRSRIRIFQIGIVGPATINLLIFFYLRFVADYTISLYTLLALGLVTNAAQTLLYVVWGPLIYDYIPSNRFGTVSAGLTFISGIVPFLMMNLAGLWVNGFTRIFGARGASTFDYSSIFVLQFIGALGGLAITWHFQREQRRGKVIPYGKLEAEREAEKTDSDENDCDQGPLEAEGNGDRNQTR